MPRSPTHKVGGAPIEVCDGALLTTRDVELLEPENTVHLVVPGRHEQDRHPVAVRAQRTAHLGSVHSRQTDVEHDEVVGLGGLVGETELAA